MARAIFFSLPLHGHVNPSLPLVRELVRRGDEVVYFGTDRFRAAIEATGARFRPYRNAYLAEMAMPPVQPDELAWLLVRTTDEILEAELEEIRALAPDYLVTDAVASWGIWCGSILRRPVISSVSTFAFNRAVVGWAGRSGVRPKSVALFLSKLKHIGKAALKVRQLRRRYRVRRPGLLESFFGRGDLNLVYTSRAFQPCESAFDDRYQFIGPSIAPRPDEDDLPWTSFRRPLLYISLGTLFNRDASFYRRCAEAFGGEALDVVLSVGSNVPLEELGPWPSNFVVRRSVPQLTVLARAAAFVSHGGMNSVSESLSFGVPLVVVPQMGEQEIVGRRVAEVGAGILLLPNQATPTALAAAVRRLLTEPQFRRAATAVGDGFRTCGGSEAGATAIAGLLERSLVHVDPAGPRSS
ncbi:MAG: macrolide family glycosyltransferase [Acidobacteriota bacterium]